MSVSFVGISFFLFFFPVILFNPCSCLVDLDHLYRKENNEATGVGSASPFLSPVTSKPRNPLARESLMASTFCNGGQDPPLHWADDELPSPAQQSFVVEYSVRPTIELSPAASPSNVISRSPSENDLGNRDAQRPPTGTNRHNFLSPGDPDNYLHKNRFSVEPIREDANATDSFKGDGVYRYEDSAEVGLDRTLEMEVDELLEELMDHHSKRRATMTSASLLPPPEELFPTASPRLYPDSPLPQLVTASMLFGGDSDAPSFTSSSPRSSKGSHFSPTRSPSLRSRRSFTPITPSTDGWRNPPSLASVPEYKTSIFDRSGHTRLSGHLQAWSPHPREVPEGAGESCASASYEDHRAHHRSLPPIRTRIPEDSTIHRRGKGSISLENKITDDNESRVESVANRSLSSRFSDDDASEITEMGYLDHGFDHLFPSNSSAVSIRFAQPGVDSPHGLDPFGGRYSPTSSINPGFVDYPLPTVNVRPAPSPKRGVLQSLFSQRGSSEQKKERRWSKGRETVRTQAAASQSTGTLSFATTSSKSSKDKEKKSGKTERRVQLAAQLKAKELQYAWEKDGGNPSRTTLPGNPSAAWEERGAMYSMDGIF